jgi:uncharacterized GH25 family protein
MRKLAFLLIALATAASASAHDLWMQPDSFSLQRPGNARVSILVGHGQDRENWGIRSDRIILLRHVGPNGQATNLMPLLRPNSALPALDLSLSQTGTHLIAMQSNHSQSELPGARFTEFLKEEGLTPALLHRQRTGASGKPGREVYSRRAKTLVQVGKVDTKQASPSTKRLGFSLEIVPERDPYRMAPSEDLPVRVFYEGRPLAGALVKLTNLDADAKPVSMKRTDGAGRARFAIPRKGKWLLNVVWIKQVTNVPNADYQTTFSSLTFGY